ncbi:MAG: transposase [Verrucomicrobiales bacterium]
MFLDISRVRSAKGVTYSRVLLRSSFRENGKVRHRTLGNLSSCSEEEINAVRLALKHKEQLAQWLAADAFDPKPTAPARAGAALPAEGEGGPPFIQGPGVGAVAVLRGIAEDLGILEVLGADRQGRLALWQVIARALDQGSRLSAVRLARDLGAACVLGLPSFDEDDLYANLAWLSDRQEVIERDLFARRPAQEKPSLYLYDVTSTYLEGDHNELAAFGYNRDGKRGKKQIVIGLLCDERGRPVALEAFRGNTADPKTVSSQIDKLRQRFGAHSITLVGDRGMLRGPQLTELSAAGLHYITAISKPQIETMLASGTLQMELFDQELGEVLVPSTVPPPSPPATEDSTPPDTPPSPPRMERFILRRNPVRQAEIAANRSGKQHALKQSVSDLNTWLAQHPRAKVSTAIRRIDQRLKRLGLSNWMSVHGQERTITLKEDPEALREESKLDGCYVLRTDLLAQEASKETVHARYKSLGEVEQAFRRSKTVELEMRPVHVRKDSSTRGHLLVVMLAYLIMKELGERWAHLDITVKEGLDRLNTYCAVEIAGVIKVMLQPRADVQSLLTAAKVTLPTSLPGSKSKVATRKNLPKNRPTRVK